MHSWEKMLGNMDLWIRGKFGDVSEWDYNCLVEVISVSADSTTCLSYSLNEISSSLCQMK